MISFPRFKPQSLAFLTGFVLLSFLGTTPSALAADCTNAYTKDTAVPTGYGAAYDLFSTAKDLLIKGSDCAASSFKVTAGNTQTQYAFKSGYFWNGTAWTAYSFTGQEAGTDWLTSPATATVSTSSQTGAFVVAYICQRVNNAWKCGCHDEACTTPMWQIQKVTSGTSGGGSVGGVRGRVHVGNGTVLTDQNTLIRGAAYAGSDDTFLKHLRDDLKLNAIRLDFKTVQIGKTIQDQLPAIDKTIDAAGRNHMYVMMHYSVAPGGYAPLQAMKDFWTVVAPRYKDRTHVFYEMINEPTQWGQISNFTDQVLTDLKSVYDIMRAGAPDTHIVLFSTANFYPSPCADYKAMIAKGTNGVDWTKASVGYHYYNGTVQFGEAGLKCLQETYPLLMTETSYWVDNRPEEVKRGLLLHEKLGISWFSLDGKGGSSTHLENEILPELHNAGYNWSAEN